LTSSATQQELQTIISAITTSPPTVTPASQTGQFAERFDVVGFAEGAESAEAAEGFDIGVLLRGEYRLANRRVVFA
jgi:hypothetical protein